LKLENLKLATIALHQPQLQLRRLGEHALVPRRVPDEFNDHILHRVDHQTVANNVLCIEAFPYHSYRSPGFPGVLPSQHYSFGLVRRAIERGALILMANTIAWWQTMVPELKGYQHVHIATNPQGGYVTPGFYPQAFDQLVSILGHCS